MTDERMDVESVGEGVVEGSCWPETSSSFVSSISAPDSISGEFATVEMEDTVPPMIDVCLFFFFSVYFCSVNRSP